MHEKISLLVELLNRALEESELEEDYAQKVSYLIRIANILNDIGEKEKAKEILLKAVEATDNIEVQEDSTELLLEIYEYLLTYGFFEEAKGVLKKLFESTKKLGNQELKLRVYETLLTILAENNLLKTIEELSPLILDELKDTNIPSLNSPEVTINVLRKLSIVVSPDEIKNILEKYIKLSDTINDEDIRVYFLIDIGSLAYQLGLNEVVKSVFNKLEYLDDKLDLLTDLSDQVLEGLETDYLESID